jgi:hypothetical protein
MCTIYTFILIPKYEILVYILLGICVHLRNVHISTLKYIAYILLFLNVQYRNVCLYFVCIYFNISLSIYICFVSNKDSESFFF